MISVNSAVGLRQWRISFQSKKREGRVETGCSSGALLVLAWVVIICVQARAPQSEVEFSADLSRLRGLVRVICFIRSDRK